MAIATRENAPKWENDTRINFVQDMTHNFDQAYKDMALTHDAFIPCTAAYDSTTKRHTLTPAQDGLTLPEVFTVRFTTAAAFTAGDKVYIGGVEYTPAYIDSTDGVITGVWVAGAVVGITCVQTGAKAFVGAAVAQKADKNTVYTALENTNSVAKKIKDSVERGIFKGTFYVINADDCPEFSLIRYSATFQGYTNACNVERFDIDTPKQYTRRIDATLGVWKDSNWQEIATTESGFCDLGLLGDNNTGTWVNGDINTARYIIMGSTVFVWGVIRGTLTGSTGGIKVTQLPVPFRAGPVGLGMQLAGITGISALKNIYCLSYGDRLLLFKNDNSYIQQVDLTGQVIIGFNLWYEGVV